MTTKVTLQESRLRAIIREELIANPEALAFLQEAGNALGKKGKRGPVDKAREKQRQSSREEAGWEKATAKAKKDGGLAEADGPSKGKRGVVDKAREKSRQTGREESEWQSKIAKAKKDAGLDEADDVKPSKGKRGVVDKAREKSRQSGREEAEWQSKIAAAKKDAGLDEADYPKSTRTGKGKQLADKRRTRMADDEADASWEDAEWKARRKAAE